MKKISLDSSYVIVYTPDGFYVVPGHAVVDLFNGGKVYGMTISSFLKQFLMCFVGDHKLYASDDGTLAQLAERTDARNALLFKVEENRSSH